MERASLVSFVVNNIKGICLWVWIVGLWFVVIFHAVNYGKRLDRIEKHLGLPPITETAR